MGTNNILKIDELPKHLIDIYMAETKKKTSKGVYENYYADLKGIIIKYLDIFQKGNYTYYQDSYGNMYVTPNKSSNSNIILSAHMDKIHTNGRINKLFYDTATGKIFAKNKDNKQTSLGADDKNGIFCILEIYKRVQPEELPSVIFTVDEESGCIGSTHVDISFFENKSHCIVIDRRNANDLIYKGGSCLYGITTPPLFKMLNPDYDYTIGSCSDANNFSEHIDCMNVSCGYYNPHSSTEYPLVHELMDTCDAVETFVLNANTIPCDAVSYQEYLIELKGNTHSTYSSGNYNWKSSTTNHIYYYGDYTDDYSSAFEDDFGSYTSELTDCPYCKRKHCYSKVDDECLWCDFGEKGGDKEDAKVPSVQQNTGGQGSNVQQEDESLGVHLPGV